MVARQVRCSALSRSAVAGLVPGTTGKAAPSVGPTTPGRSRPDIPLSPIEVRVLPKPYRRLVGGT